MHAYDNQILDLENDFGPGAGLETIFQDCISIGESKWADWVSRCWQDLCETADVLAKMPDELKDRL